MRRVPFRSFAIGAVALRGRLARAAAVRRAVDDDGDVGTRGRGREGGKETCCALRHGLCWSQADGRSIGNVVARPAPQKINLTLLRINKDL